MPVGADTLAPEVLAPLDRLRRLDWRWLLPHPPEEPFERLILCGADDHTAQLTITSGLARRVDHTVSGLADAVAVFAGADVRVRDVTAALAPGGVVYWETDRRQRHNRRCTPQRRSDSLTAAGLEVDAQYVIRPHPSRAELYLPFDRVAWRWFLDTVYVAERPAQWALEQIARLVVSTGGISALAPYHAVVAHRPPSTQPTVAARAAALVGSSARRAALVTDSGNRAVAIGFGSQRAAIVTKLPKRAEFSGRTEHEQRVTDEIRSAIGPERATALPRPLGTLRLGGITASIETALPGASMQRTSARWGRSLHQRGEDLQRAIDWIATLHGDHPIRAGVWDHDRQRDVLEAPLRRYTEHFGENAAEALLFEAARAAGAELYGRDLPVVWQHRDYSPSNVHADAGAVRVLDWEGAMPGIPYADPLRFAISWQQAVCGRRTSQERAASIAALVADSGTHTQRRAAKRARAALARYADITGIDPAFQPVLLVASAVEHALRRLQQQEDAGIAIDVPAATLRGGNLNVELVEHLTGHTALLFGHRP